MPVISIRIPQLGEGLQEARLIEYLKQPGDAIQRDEAIYVMETDKAVTEVESPAAGTLTAWLVAPNTVVAIGTEVGQMEVAEGCSPAESPAESGAAPGAPQDGSQASAAGQGMGGAGPAEGGYFGRSVPASVSGTTPGDPSAMLQLPKRHRPQRAAGGVRIPPRTRRYLKLLGLTGRGAEMTAEGTKLMPADVDRWLSRRFPAEGAATPPPASAAARRSAGGDQPFEERPLPAEQQTLNYRLARGAQLAVPATLVTEVDWAALDAARRQTREYGGPTGFAMLLWCVVQAMRDFPLLRSTLSGDGKLLRTYSHVNLGVAVALPDNGLRAAVVRQADTLDRATFFRHLAEQIAAVRQGADQADAATTVTVSNMGAAGMQLGIPVVVTPAVATLALGAIRLQPHLASQGIEFRKAASLAMTFDHRVLNGLAAAEFLRDVCQRAADYQLAPHRP